MHHNPQPDMLREQTGSGTRSLQALLALARDAHPLSSWRWRYGMALVAIGVAFLVRHLLAPILDDRAVFMIFLGVVMLSAWYGGLSPGLLATGLSVLIISYILLPPRDTPALDLAGDSVVFTLFMATGVGISLLLGQLHVARQRAAAWAYEKAQAEEALKAANTEAERRAQSAAGDHKSDRQLFERAVEAEIVQTLNASLDLDTVLQRVVEAARELSHSECALIFLREPGAETLVARYQVGYPEMPFADLRIEPGKGISGQVLATGRPQCTADYAADPRFSKDYLPRLRAGGRLAVIAVPIAIGDAVEGVLYVSNPASRPFAARDESVLLRLAAYAATALHNAQLYQQAQEALAARRRAEAALRQAHAVAHEQHERLHVTLSSIGDAVMVTDNQGRVTFLNPVAAALTGWSEAEALGQDNMAVFPIVNEYTRQAVENPIARVIQEGVVVGLANHTLLIAKDGVERPIDDSAAPIRDAQGRLLGVVLVFRDITARRQAEAAQVRLAALVASSEDAIIGKTLEGIITSWNQGAEHIYGYKAEDVIGQSLAFLMPPDRPDELPEILARVARGEAIVRYETERMRQDGTVIPVSLTISPLRDPSGAIVGASTIARDITAQKQAAAEVERRRQETELLAEIAQHLSASLDLDTVLQRVVAGAQELCGSERALIMLRESDSDVLVVRYEVGAPQMAYAGLRLAPGMGLGGQVLRSGRPWRTDNYAADPRFSKDYLPRARAAGNLAIVAVPIKIGARVEGVLYVSNHASRPFTERDEEILERLAVHAALTIHNAQLYRQAQAELAERQKAEASLAQAAATLERRVAERTAALEQAMAEQRRLEREAQRTEHFVLLGRLAAGVSHELRNPLGAVFLHVDLLAEELAQPSPDSQAVMAEYLGELKTELARVDDIIQDYLSLVRVHAIQREVQDLGTAAIAWCREFQEVVAAHGARLEMDGVDELGLVAFHASTLRRALLNLVQNAAEAMAPGGTVTLVGRSTAEQVQLEVRDTGCGVAAERLGQIFEPLHTTKSGGTGLGLHIVQEVAVAHGGQVTVQSVEGEGATFTITLPRATTLSEPTDVEA